VLDIDDLVRFFQNPARELLRRRAGLSLELHTSPLSDDLPLRLSGLERWATGQKLFEDLITGASPAKAATLARLSGLVPPGEVGAKALSWVSESAISLSRSAGDHWRDAETQTVAVQVGDVLISGSLLIHDGQVIEAGFGGVDAKRLVRTWLRLLVAAAANQAASAFLFGPGEHSQTQRIRLIAPSPDRAGELLAEFLALWQSGLQTLLPLPLNTAAAYTGGLTPIPQSDPAAGRRAWESPSQPRGDARDPYWAHFGIGTFNDLLAIPPATTDPIQSAQGRFAGLASWLWSPIAAAQVQPQLAEGREF
jgi:exodeoxyribonuclease V gamma subunit